MFSNSTNFDLTESLKWFSIKPVYTLVYSFFFYVMHVKVKCVMALGRLWTLVHLIYVCVQREDLESELEKAAHYMQFAVAAYGWPIYVYLNPLTGFCKLSGNWYVFSEPS